MVLYLHIYPQVPVGGLAQSVHGFGPEIQSLHEAEPFSPRSHQQECAGNLFLIRRNFFVGTARGL